MQKKLISILAALALPACAPTLVPAPSLPATEPAAEATNPGFDATRVRTDLESTARQRFGDALTDRALASPNFLFSKHYVGLPPPPILQPDGSYKEREPAMALLVRENGRWLVATADGFRAANPDKAADIDALLADQAFWDEPAWSQPTCTDSGGSLLMLKIAPRAPTTPVVRQGACGATRQTERLVFLALEA